MKGFKGHYYIPIDISATIKIEPTKFDREVIDPRVVYSSKSECPDRVIEDTINTIKKVGYLYNVKFLCHYMLGRQLHFSCRESSLTFRLKVKEIEEILQEKYNIKIEVHKHE